MPPQDQQLGAGSQLDPPTAVFRRGALYHRKQTLLFVNQVRPGVPTMGDQPSSGERVAGPPLLRLTTPEVRPGLTNPCSCSPQTGLICLGEVQFHGLTGPDCRVAGFCS